MKLQNVEFKGNVKRMGSYIKNVMLDYYYEVFIWVAIVAVLVLQNFIPLEFSRTVEDLSNVHIKETIEGISFLEIISWFNSLILEVIPKENIVSIWTLFRGLSLLMLGELSVSVSKTRLIAMTLIDLLGNTTLIVFTFFVPIYSQWYYVVFGLMCLNVFVSFFKYVFESHRFSNAGSFHLRKKSLKSKQYRKGD